MSESACANSGDSFCPAEKCECGTPDCPSAGEQTAMARAILIVTLQQPALHPTKDTECVQRKAPGPGINDFVTTQLGRWQLLISPSAYVLRSTFSIKAQTGREQSGADGMWHGTSL